MIVAVGELGSQAEDEADPDRVARMMTVNLTWPAAALSAVAARLRRQGHGRIIVLSSVAGTGSAARTSSTAPRRLASTPSRRDCAKLFVAPASPCTSSVQASCTPR